MTLTLYNEFRCPAVLLLVFNRPQQTARVFDAIRKARPSRLYVSADGARAHRAGEGATVEEVKKIVTAVDWPCQLVTLFRNENLGCGRAVSSAIDWFFRHEAEGVVLEDDCLPHPDFFAYCAELLARYRDDDRVGIISGTALGDLRREGLAWGEEDYVYSRYLSVWGWASWRRVLKGYDFTIADWERRRNDILGLTANHRLRAIHAKVFDDVSRGYLDTWDYQLSFLMWTSHRLAVSPRFNLVENIGFGVDATHTVRRGGEIESRSKSSSERLSFPLESPPLMCPNRAYEKLLEKLATRPLIFRALHTLFYRK